MNESDLSMVEVVPYLPARLPSNQGEPFPAELVGAEIIGIGTLADSGAVEGGGLVIDYRERGGQLVHRIVFAFNELGMWVECQQRQQSATSPASVQE